MESSPEDQSQIKEELVGVALPKSVLKKLGIKYEREQSEKQKARNEKLRQMALERHAKVRADKERFEKEQLEKIAKRVQVVQKIKKAKEDVPFDADDENDSDLLEYLEYQKFKKSKTKVAEPKVERKSVKKEIPPPDSDSEDDGFIQKKAEKATKVIEAVNKLDKAINQLQPANPYLAFFKNNKN